MKEIENAEIPLKDGTRLAVRLWLPDDAARAPVPALLEYLPYRKRDGTRERDSLAHPWFAAHGYACARVDVRGSGESEGVLSDEYSQQELDDGVEVIAWLAAQRWCSGSVGMFGISWGGFNALQVAALRPPALKAIVTLCSTDDRYADDVHYWGGALLADYQLPWATTMLGYNARPPEPVVWGDGWLDEWRRRLDATPPFIAEWLAHQRRDAYWRHGSVCEDPSAIRCPVFLVGGWADAYRDAVFRLLGSLTVPRRGLVGPWAHAWPHFAEPGPRVGFLREAVRWWDRWLKDIPNGVEREPVLRSWLQDSVPPRGSYDERPGRWVVEDGWPSANIDTHELALGPGTAVLDPGSAEVPESAVELVPVQSHGVLGGRSCSYGTSYDLAVDQRADDAVAVCFDSEPLAERAFRGGDRKQRRWADIFRACEPGKLDANALRHSRAQATVHHQHVSHHHIGQMAGQEQHRADQHDEHGADQCGDLPPPSQHSQDVQRVHVRVPFRLTRVRGRQTHGPVSLA